MESSEEQITTMESIGGLSYKDTSSRDDNFDNGDCIFMERDQCINRSHVIVSIIKK